MNTLSEALRDLMDRQKMTGVKLAEEIGLSATSVSQILNGKNSPQAGHPLANDEGAL